VSLSRENGIPIIVFSIHERGALAAVLRGEGRATIIGGPAS
jgi:uridylate kinase